MSDKAFANPTQVIQPISNSLNSNKLYYPYFSVVSNGNKYDNLFKCIK